MKQFKNICKKSQKDLAIYLKQELVKIYGDGNVLETIKSGGFIFAEGEFPVLLVAHLDTVHKKLPKTFVWDNKLKALSSPQGIGGDDRCGVYMILQIIQKYKCSVLFCEDEEIGGIGASTFVNCIDEIKEECDLDFNYIIEFDRMHGKDAVFYSCDNQEFEDFITKDFYDTSFGSFSDISIIAPKLGIAAVNLSCGYYNAHTQSEYVVMPEMQASINAAMDILERTTDKDKFKYIEADYKKCDWFGLNSLEYYERALDDFEDLNRDKILMYEVIYLEDCVEKTAAIEALSFEEAIGILLMEHPRLCYNDIVDIY